MCVTFNLCLCIVIYQFAKHGVCAVNTTFGCHFFAKFSNLLIWVVYHNCRSNELSNLG